MSILRRYINMIGAANNLNPDDVEKPINVLQFNRRVFKNSQVRIYSGLKWPDMTKPAAERIENPDGSIAKIKFNGHYHTTFNGAPAFAGLAIPVHFSVKPGEKIVWRVRGKTNKKHIGLPVDVWFKQRPPIVSYQVTNLLGSYGSFSVDSDGDGLADGWTIEGYQPDLKVVSNSIQYLKKTTTKQWTFIASQFIPTNNTDKWFFKIKSKTYSTNPAQSPHVHLYEFVGADINNNYIWQSGGGKQIYGNPNSDFNVYYTSHTFTNPNVVKLRILSFYIDHPNYTTGVINEAWIDYAMVVNLTSMGELPQTLKQFFAPSNITRWDQLATSSNITATNGRVMPGNDWLNLLIPYGENTYAVQLEYDSAAETWIARTTTTRQGSAIYNVNNLLGNTGSFSSSSGGLGTGWQLQGNYTPSISSGRQVLTLNNFTNNTGNTITHRIRQNLTNMINEHYYYFYFQASVSNPSIPTYCWIDLYNGSTPQWGVAAKLVQATALTDYADVFQVLNNNSVGSISLGVISQPTDTTYTQTFTVDNVMLVDLTAMGELPPKIREKFPTLKYWYQFATQSMITAADGSAISGVDWLRKFLPFNDRNYTVSLQTNTPQDAAVYVQSKPSTTGKYTITNLLGSFGSFSVDSDGDGVADGWILTNRNTVEACVVSNGIQYYTKTAQALAPQHWVSIWSQHIPTNNTDRWFIKARAKVQSTQSSSDVVRTLYALGRNSSNVDVWSTGGVTSLYFPFNADFQTSYTSYTFTNTAVVAFRLMGFYVEHSYLPIGSVNEVWIDYAQVVNLTAMGELPQALKQFFAPSNIIRWDQLATSSNITAINGQIKTGNDWLNLLIPYGEGTYTVEYAILPDGQLATWVSGDEQESTYNAIATIDSASVLNNLQYYEVTNLLGSYGSFSTDSDGDGLADGWDSHRLNSYQLVGGRQQVSGTPGAWTALRRYMTFTEGNRMFFRIDMQYTREMYIYFNVGGTILYSDLSGVGKSWFTFYRAYTHSNGNGEFRINVSRPSPSFTDTNIATVDNVLFVDLTTMGELPQPLKQFFAPSNITRWDQLATSSNITAINGQVQRGEDWLNILIPYGEGTYRVWYAIGPNNRLIVSTKPSELVNTAALAAVKKELMEEAIGIYEPTTEGYIDEIIISPNTDNGEAKDFELEIESVDVFKIPANTTPLTRARYTITNLLGSYGSFSVDSNGDGVADGWTFVYSNQTITSGKQRIVITK